MMGKVGQQPLDGVKCIGGFIRQLVRWIIGRHFPEISFAHIPSAYILVYKNVFLFHQGCIWTDAPGVFIFSIRSRTVRCPFHQDRMILRAVFWNIDHRIQLHAVTHRDAHVFLNVMGFYIVVVLGPYS